MEESSSSNSAAEKAKENKERLLSALSTLYLFSKTRPELLILHAVTLHPYLTTTSTGGDQEARVLIQVHICILCSVYHVPLSAD